MTEELKDPLKDAWYVHYPETTVRNVTNGTGYYQDFTPIRDAMVGKKMTDKLKPVRCGCGGSPIIRNERGKAVYVQCVSCGTRSIETNRAEAVEAWNRAMGWVSADEETVDKGLLHLLHAIMQPHEIVAMNINLKGLHRALQLLPENHRDILTKYYCEGKTLDEIGKDYNVTRERIRQLRERGLHEMRHPLMRKWYCEVDND